MKNVASLDQDKGRMPPLGLPRFMACALTVLTLFFSLHVSSARIISQIEIISMTEPAPLKSPTIQTNDVVKFVSRVQDALKIPQPEKNEREKDIPFLFSKEKATASSRSENAHIFENSEHIPCCPAHHRYPRAPPAFLT